MLTIPSIAVQQWQGLGQSAQQQLLQRPLAEQDSALKQQVQTICEAVKTGGDKALLGYTQSFDCATLTELAVAPEQIASAEQAVSADVRAAIDAAYANIYAFHQRQQPRDIVVETQQGVTCEQRFAALDAVGLYVPGGSAVLPSTALMLGIPAQLAGCRRVVLVSPPSASGELPAALLYAAKRCGISEIYRCGGAQAIAALAYGTESIASVDKIFGPGNRYVTQAKQYIANSVAGCSIDMPAGPSELMVIADSRANPRYIAADLLSQAEHGADSQVLLLTPSLALADAVVSELRQQVGSLSRADIAAQALANSRIILVNAIQQAIEISQRYAPEHLSLQLEDAEQWLPQLTRAGSIFVGDYTPESGGDYATGTNHVLPTNGYAKSFSSLGLTDFYRRYTVQTVTADGLRQLAPTITTLANLEGLDAHARAVSIRVEERS
ncbi:histidinol dehydrogenase [Idiomarina tyrosinivorans]|uniref:Histidinol dehydrogenase n=1 Tax=Idiomarina tyrosinivorans TaxID=1445662 RepID=A0A432ZLM9_9GAMM|nr:histidinol dehydrogenase [Idiomarina tyrosinivorans]RUO78804.1 histidinol dehydrogenase [Idiomarina tyrosinivorans]